MTNDQQSEASRIPFRGDDSQVDILLFGAHPDDVEWGAGGTLLNLQRNGTSFGIVDLTRGEMGSRGTLEERNKEAEGAAMWMGARFWENLGLPDCGIINSVENRRLIASAIRKWRPKLILAPYWTDRHPDHAATGNLIRNAAIYCTLKTSSDPNPPHKPSAYLYYLLHHFTQPGMVVDISEIYQRKLELLRIHSSQFSKTAEGFGVLPVGMNDYLFGLESRDRFFGSLIGVHHGEAFVSEVPLKLGSIGDLPSLW
jgi:bacillithiol biosynthesis deacetylase BshB1